MRTVIPVIRKVTDVHIHAIRQYFWSVSGTNTFEVDFKVLVHCHSAEPYSWIISSKVEAQDELDAFRKITSHQAIEVVCKALRKRHGVSGENIEIHLSDEFKQEEVK